MCLSDLRKLFLALVLLCAPAVGFAAGNVDGESAVKPVEIHLNADISVAGESITLGDVATIQGKDEKDVDALAALQISQFPAGQTEMQLPSSYLARRISEILPNTEYRLDAPEQVVFHQRHTGISEQEVKDLLTQRARSEGKIPEWVETQVEITSGMDALKGLRLADVQIEPAGSFPAWKGDLVFKVRSGDAVTWLRAKVRWYGQVWAAKHDLFASQNPKAEDFEISRVEITTIREDVAGATDSLETLLRASRLRRQIRAHAPLIKAALERAPDARSGQSLKVVFVSESGIRVSADGVLISGGSVGEDVRARLNTSHKVVVGRLVQPNLVEVSL